MADFQAIDRQLAAARQVGDPPGDDLVSCLVKNNFSLGLAALHRWAEESASPIPEELQPKHFFWSLYKKLPDWADAELIKTGQNFFHRHVEEIMLLLGFLSLPYCYAAANGAKVLCRSRRIMTDTRRRLAETARFVLSVHQANAFDCSGAILPQPLRQIVAVRLMHAVVRYHLSRSSKWNVQAWGLPVNQEDMAGTNLAFSFITLQGLRKIGLPVEWKEAHGFLHLWNLVGYFLGIFPQWLPTDMRAAACLEKTIAQRQFRSSPEGRALAKALIDSISSHPQRWSFMQVPGFVPSLMRFLLGEHISNLLNLPPATLPFSIFRLYRLGKRFNSNGKMTAKNFQLLLQRLYGKLSYPIPEQIT